MSANLIICLICIFKQYFRKVVIQHIYFFAINQSTGDKSVFKIIFTCCVALKCFLFVCFGQCKSKSNMIWIIIGLIIIHLIGNSFSLK